MFLSIFATKVDDVYNLTGLGYAALIIVMLGLLVFAAFLTGKKNGGKSSFNTKQLVFSAMAVALAMVTSFLKLFDMPMGGSVTLFSMMFITLIGYWYGLKIGLITAVAYGFLQLIVDPYILTVPQMLVDYIFAFGALGLSGLFKDKKNGLYLGYLTGVFGRFVFSVLSGIIFFAAYAEGSGMSPFLYSVTYNGSYLGIEAVLTLVLMVLPPVHQAIGQVRKLAVQA